MACYHPLKGYRSQTVNPSGKRSIVFTKHEGFIDLPLELPCGQCIGCKLERSRMWAVRCFHEASLHQHNSYITLTYSQKYLPKDLSLKKKHFQLFMKKLRDHRTREYGPWPKDGQDRRIRFFMCGEYGENYGRPHYHACLFNYDFPDKYHWKTRNGFKVWRSPHLEKLWPLGNSEIGEVTFESAAYVARYITKKITGPTAYEHYNVVDKTTGEILAERFPEYTDMSRKPGVGKEWYEKYKSDVFPDDFAIIRKGDKLIKCKPPKYYRDQLEKDDKTMALQLKIERKDAAQNNVDNTWDRLRVREEIQYEKLKQLKRSFENGQT